MKTLLIAYFIAIFYLRLAAGSYMYPPIFSTNSDREESVEFAIRLFDVMHDAIAKEFGSDSGMEISVSLNKEHDLYTYVVTYPATFTDLQIQALTKAVGTRQILADKALEEAEGAARKIEELRKKGDGIRNRSRDALMSDLTEAFRARVEASPVAYWNIIIKKTEPNKAMEPTPVNVTVPADAGPAPFTSAAHLGR